MGGKTGFALGLGLAFFQTLGWSDEPRRPQDDSASPKRETALPVEQAPLPQPTGNLLLPVVPVYTPPEHGRLSVWQLYGVDITGRFRPRVIVSPQGAYYLYNFAPYPWTTTNNLRYMPYAVD
jgi:hypothetical protein